MAETNTKDHKENPDGASKETEKINGGEHNGDKKKKDAASSFGQHGRTLATSKSLFATGFAPAINKSHVEKLFFEIWKNGPHHGFHAKARVETWLEILFRRVRIDRKRPKGNGQLGRKNAIAQTLSCETVSCKPQR
mmetsp:Transcript_22195/g.46648  ORF Transcript_22195/g.46648 Transcript_22195/m.46648 type:complete len:136 (+) Transcript_22195:40-447(+)